MYGLQNRSEWVQIDNDTWHLTCRIPNTAKRDLDLLTKDLILVIVVRVWHCGKWYWTGRVPPRTRNHLPLKEKLSEIFKEAMLFVEQRDSVLRTLTSDYIPDETISIRTLSIPLELRGAMK